MYDIERHCSEIAKEQRKEYRNEQSRPILEEFKKWLDGSRKYQPSRLYVRGDVVTSSVLEGFSMDLSEVFEPYDWVAHDEAEKYYHLI